MKRYSFKFLVPLFFFSAISLFAQTNEGLALSSLSLSDPRAKWSVGFCQFQSIALSPSHSNLLKTIPNLIYQKLSNCKEHILTQEEKLFLLENIFDAAIRENQKQLSALQKEIDLLFFNRSDTVSTKTTKQKSIRELFLKIDELTKAKENIDLYTIEPIKQVEFISASGEDFLFPSLIQKPTEFMRDKKLDMFITGVVEEIEGYIYFTASLYSCYSDNPIVEFTSGALANEVQSIIEKSCQKMIEQLLGREWASVTVEAQPFSASIRFNDGERGVGIVERIYIKPGQYKIRLDAPGYISEEIELNLNMYDELSYSFTMQKDLINPIVVQTIPNNADFYLSSQWKGKTPLLIEDAGIGEPFILRKDGFSDYYGSMSDYEELTSPLISLDLKSSLYLSEELLRSKREDLYNSLTMMAVSVPFFLFGLSYDKKWEEFESSLSTNPLSYGTSGIMKFDKNFFDVKRTRSGLALINQAGLTLFVVSIVNLIIDMVEYVQIYDKM